MADPSAARAPHAERPDAPPPPPARDLSPLDDLHAGAPGGDGAPSADAPWTPQDAADLYHVAAWGEGYVEVNAAGHVAVRPDPRQDVAIDLADVVDEIVAKGWSGCALRRSSWLARSLHSRC